MPVRFVVPLPGPFYWVPKHHQARTRTAAHRSRFHSAAYWLLGGWALEIAFWVTVACCVTAWWLLRLTYAGLLYLVGVTAVRIARHL